MGTTLRQGKPTKRFRQLTCDTSLHDVADRCRSAVLAFLEGPGAGWSVVDVDRWLGTPYRDATAIFGRASGSARTTFSAVNDRSAEFRVEASLLEAGDRIREMLASCSDGPQPLFVTDAIECGLVAGIVDRLGSIGYIPVDVGEMDLVERLKSLVAADFLTRPNDYRSLTICDDCGGVSFDWTSCIHRNGPMPCESGFVCRADEGAPRSSYEAIFPPRAV